MSLHLYCPTAEAALLLAVVGPTFRFPSHAGERPGLWLRVTPRTPINEQLQAAAEAALGINGLGRHLQIDQSFAQPMTFKDAQPATLYLARLDGELLADRGASWPTMPELFARMPRDRSRLPYLLAWQVLS